MSNAIEDSLKCEDCGKIREWSTEWEEEELKQRWELWKAETKQWIKTGDVGMNADEYLDLLKWIWDAGAEAAMDAAGGRIDECEAMEKCRCKGSW